MAVGENESLQYDITDDSVPPYNPKHRFSLAFKRASYQAPEEIWNLFSEAEDCCDIIDYFNALIKSLNIDRNIHGVELYDILKSKLTSWKCQSLWDLLNARLKHSEYKQGNAAKGKTCMIIGCGPIGLRTAIECLMLGCKTIIVEKRDEFARNNVLHLWPFLMTDFRNLGAKKFFGKFGAGCIEHINIKTLQSILLKVALILGAEVYVGVCFNNLVEPVDENTGWRGSFLPENHVLSKAEFDIIIGADGKKNILPGFEQIELRGALAIGITCNFVNNNTIEEARVNEISGISFQYNQNFFLKMEEKYGVRLENIVYYKDETHYFVMTALKNSLLKLEVLKEDFSDPSKLITSSNIDKQKLMEFARSAVDFATDHQLPEDLEYNKLSNGEPDIALFDFTSLKKASNASRIIERNKKKLLLTLVGDSLIEPFWPTGSGAGRGVLSALDCAWLIKQYCSNHPPLACVRERENIYKLLSGITNDSLQKNHKAFTIDPKTRYTAFDSRKVSNIASLQSLYDTDDLENADLSVTSPQQKEKDTSFVKKRRRSSSGGGKKKTITSTHVHPHGQTVVTGKKRTSPLKDTKQEPTVGNTKQFWEEHNKKNLTDRAKQHVSKAKKRTTPSIEEEGIDMEGWSEIDDDVIEDSKLSARSTKSIKSARDKSPRENKENSLKRQKTKDNLLKRQKSKEALSPTKSKPSKAKTPDSKKGTLKKENTKRKISMKQDPARPVDPKSFFRIWLNKIQEKFKEKANINQDDPEAVNNGPSALVMATQSAALGGMALPMLLDCNRPPKRRTTDIKLRDLQLAKQALLNPSTDAHKETQDISVKRAGSVRNTIEKLKEITKDGNPSNYYDFVNKKPNSNDKVDGKSTDFTPKVIDVEAMVRKEEKEEQKKSKAVKATWNLTSSDSESQLRASLEEFCEPQTPLASVLMLQVLYNIHKRIYDEPHVEKYYRIFIKGTVFERYVWQLEGASKFLQFLGWIKCGNYIVLSKSYPVATSLKVIESVLRRKKRAEGGISRQTSLKNRHPNVDIIGEDEVVASFTKVENDIDSGVEDVEASLRRKPKLRRVESKEHLLGEEEYVVVDFVGNVELSSRKSSRVEQPDNLQLDVHLDEEEPESAIGMTPPSSQSPTSNISTTFDDISDNIYVAASLEKPSVEISTNEKPEESLIEKSDIDVPFTGNQERADVEIKIDVDVPVAPISEYKAEEVLPKQSDNVAEKPKSKGLKGLKNRRKTEEIPTPPKAETPPQTDSPTLMSRSSSNRSISSRRSIDESGSRRGSPRTSTVLQNKLLFDQKASGQFKKSPSSSSITSLNSLREGRKESLRGSNGRPVSGTVAGTLSMFEANSPGGRSKNATKKKADNNWGASLETKPTPVAKVEEPAPTLEKPPVEESKPVSTGKKKRFPFKKKKSSNISNKDVSETPSGDVQLVSATPVKSDFQERAIDVPTEMVQATDAKPNTAELKVEEPIGEKKKKSGSLMSRMKRRSRKSSTEHSDNELTTSVEIAAKVEDPVIEESSTHLPPIVDSVVDQTLPEQSVSIDVKQPESPPDPIESDASFSIDSRQVASVEDLVSPAEDPPSPAQASEEVKSLLESIIDRKPVEDSSSTTKKKKLRLKKKSNSKIETEKPLPSVELVVTPTPVKEEVVDEGISENKITDDVSISDWPEEMMNDNNNDVIVEDEKKVEPLPTIEGELESPLATSELIPQISVEPADDTVTNDVTDGHDDGMMDVSLHDDNASSIYSPDDDSLSMTGSINTEKKKKRRFKFGLRKSSSKKKEKQQQLSPQNESDIWEHNDDHKLEKKNSSKKLKRPKSLDFLADVIHPSHKKDDKKQRPVSVAEHAEEQPPAPKSPTKRKTLSLFKKKKKQSSSDTSTHDRTISDVESDQVPSPTDVFKIPDVVDGGNKNGHATLSVDHSEHSVNTEMSLSVK